MSDYALLTTGDPAPYFVQKSLRNPRYTFDTAAGRYLVLCFFGSAAAEDVRNALAKVHERTQVFSDGFASFFGVSVDPADEAGQRIADSYPGFRYFLDYDAKISRLYGALPMSGEATWEPPTFRPMWVALDPTMRVLRVSPFDPSDEGIAKFVEWIAALPPPGRFAGVELQAPIIMLPHVFEQRFCRKLIDLYDSNGGKESGFMREVDGRTVLVHDHGHKRRRDYVIDDQTTIKETQALFMRRVVPEIKKIHQFVATRMERYIVACYAAEDEAHFHAHRDNTTKGTAHRRFAVSVNLNDDFDGGEVMFPEYGMRRFKAPAGGAVVFSCSLLHAVSKVTKGRRYAFLPFLYDEEAAKIRAENNKFLGDGVTAYAT